MKNTIILVTNNGMGKGDPALQHKLAAKYFELLAQNTHLPAAICFYTDGVKLAVTGSPVIEQLKALEVNSVHIILCSTCLDFYGLSKEVQVGIVGGMTDIITAMWRADTIISL